MPVAASAARGGSTTPFAFGDTLPHDVANTDTSRPYGEATAQPGRRRPVEVASLPANGFGLYEVHGNVWEWCQDWFDADYYSHAPLADPHGPESGTRRVLRGGSYLCHDSYCNRYRVAARNANTP